MNYAIEPIGYIRSPYKQKFGIARQPGLVQAACGCISLLPEYTADSVRGLAEFSHIWVHFIFHEAVADGWSPLVRPPRLGGKQKMGVFATRSPHRPNHLGLSLLALDHIDTDNGVRIYCRGIDLVDGTPVIDIKPYIPFVEAVPNARSGFVSGAPEKLSVQWSECAEKHRLTADQAALIEQSIAQDPRPAYQDIPERIYVMRIENWEISFQIQNRTATICAVKPHDFQAAS